MRTKIIVGVCLLILGIISDPCTRGHQTCSFCPGQTCCYPAGGVAGGHAGVTYAICCASSENCGSDCDTENGYQCRNIPTLAPMGCSYNPVCCPTMCHGLSGNFDGYGDTGGCPPNYICQASQVGSDGCSIFTCLSCPSTCMGISGKTKQFEATGGCPKNYQCQASAGSGVCTTNYQCQQCPKLCLDTGCPSDQYCETFPSSDNCDDYECVPCPQVCSDGCESYQTCQQTGDSGDCPTYECVGCPQPCPDGCDGDQSCQQTGDSGDCPTYECVCTDPDGDCDNEDSEN